FGQDRLLNLYEQPLGALVEECVAACQPRATSRGVRLEVVPGPDRAIVIDKHKITQALGNLLDNAIDASQVDGRVEVRWTLDGALVRIAIRDYGTGVPDEIRSRLFTPFCTTKREGIGLGLVLARELAEAHGGHVGLGSATPGSEFVLSLPLEL